MRTYVRSGASLVQRLVHTQGAARHNESGQVAAIELFDYQTGNFSQWNDQQYFRPEQVAIVTSPARAGYPDTARFIVAPGDYTNGGTTEERGEVAASAAQTYNPSEGQTQWFAWSSFFPTGTHVDADADSLVGNGWLLFTQWHQSGLTGNPNISFLLSKTTPVQAILRVRGQSLDGSNNPTWSNEWSLGVLPINSWVDFTVGIKWSTEPLVGHITVRMNGTQVVDAAAATLYAGMTAYLKQGIYRSSSVQTHTIYATGTKRGPTEPSVAL